MELKKKIEALLFSSGKRMHLQEIARLCSAPPDRTRSELINLSSDYETRETSLHIQNDGEYWKLATKENYSNIVKDIVKETDLTKTLMETLATIAFKYPIKQSDLIKIRTNKAYDHLMELEKMGYITRQKYGRSKLIKLTERFFNYFNLKEENLKDKFQDFQSLASAIENKEQEIDKIKQDHKERAEEARKEKKMMEQGSNTEEASKNEEEDQSDDIPTPETPEEPKEIPITDDPSQVDDAIESVLGVTDEIEKRDQQ